MSIRLDNGKIPRRHHEIKRDRVIDVILVMLIIFMIAAPSRTVAVAVDLRLNVEAATAPVLSADLLTSSRSDAVGSVMPRCEPRGAGRFGRHLKRDRTQRVFLRATSPCIWTSDGEDECVRTAGYLKVASSGLDAAYSR